VKKKKDWKILKTEHMINTHNGEHQSASGTAQACHGPTRQPEGRGTERQALRQPWAPGVLAVGMPNPSPTPEKLPPHPQAGRLGEKGLGEGGRGLAGPHTPPQHPPGPPAKTRCWGSGKPYSLAPKGIRVPSGRGRQRGRMSRE
jgi:hypothetical protein